ncbi:L,D-transpeptidase [Thermobifida halotolerans]|uniref:L,D-transpeptidase n=1 Tax=Thermobifida halotolerans TaxID=483545 RepID=UPI0008390E01|nr:Ig-like domain-containing protein [Thermobifida halotolerans]
MAGGLLLTAAGCSSEPEGNSGATPTADPVDVVVTPDDGAAEVRPDLPVTVEVSGGTITEVEVERTDLDESAEPPEESDAVTGTLNEEGTEWVSDWTLPPGGDFTVRAVVEDQAGEATEVTSSFSTLEAVEGRRLELESNFPVSGDVVGVGMPIIVNFDLPVQNKAAVEAAMEVVSDKPAQGAWNWFGDRTAVFRTEEYWEPYQEVTVNMRLAGVQASEGVYGIENYQLNFEVGRSQISEIDNDTHRMVVTRDGEQIQDFPISNGDGSTRAYTTTTGVHLTMLKFESMVMDSATVGVPEGHPDYYRLDVDYAVQISSSGEFTHAAPWNTDLGVANRSHGCTNMSTEDARWFYENSYMGDPVIITGTDRELEVDNGWGYWQRSWDEWLSHSTLGEADRTDEPGSPGSPHGTA